MCGRSDQWSLNLHINYDKSRNLIGGPSNCCRIDKNGHGYEYTRTRFACLDPGMQNYTRNIMHFQDTTQLQKT
uniref:Uncharacterized protein n=1 Tax=Arundo donax TaxID=35708 RepID=A0A0A8ZME7_ARUDO